MYEEDDEYPYKVGDLVCRVTLYTHYILKEKKIQKETFSRFVGTIIGMNENVATIKLLNDAIVHTTYGKYILLESSLAERIQFNE